MSECVVRMEMPESCAMCDLHYRCAQSRNFSGIAMICEMARLETINDKREEEHCLFICKLPEGHGRLVSEKGVRWAIDDIVIKIAERIDHVPMTKNETMEYVNQLPTIIPAERSEV